MTYCVGIKLKDGIVAMSDTRITSGSETSIAEKYKIFQEGDKNIFIMTSGLRSVRDKAITYFSEIMHDDANKFTKLYQAVNSFGNQIKRVAKEDKKTLSESGLAFNINTIVGGQLEEDEEHKLYLLYPEGNWIEIGNNHPFTIIGNSGFGTPILRRTITHETKIKFALKTAFLSFDSTRVSANDVGYPLDVLVFKKGSDHIHVKRYEHKDLQSFSTKWGEQLTQAIREVPDDWIGDMAD